MLGIFLKMFLFLYFLSVGAQSTRTIHSTLNSENEKRRFSTGLHWELEFAPLPSWLLAFLFFWAVFNASVALHQIFIFLLHFSKETMTSFITCFVSIKNIVTSCTHPPKNFLKPTLLIWWFSCFFTWTQFYLLFRSLCQCDIQLLINQNVCHKQYNTIFLKYQF